MRRYPRLTSRPSPKPTVHQAPQQPLQPLGRAYHPTRPFRHCDRSGHLPNPTRPHSTPSRHRRCWTMSN
ncbi:hypothetical protein BCR44DRAFT_1428651 [Catenaria anguillulae PL171]|uniref:Uncharacterized protein n=1 Tax=Catenaria anguillulae PL171 TaxID=765915 RepID=A0A1Y2HY27_9FUNG|nr:hypothetical protein BCR44DRAFT_1428651 [Catenaria anguillulae PL171]